MNVREIANVLEIRASEDSFYYRNESIIYNADSKLIELDNDLFGTFYVSDNGIYIQHFTGKVDYFDIKGIHLKSENGFFNYLAKNGSFFFDTNSNSMRSLDESKIEFIFENNGYIFQDYYFVNLKGEIKSYSISANTLNWQCDNFAFGTYLNNWQEEKSHEVKKFIGIWNKQVVVQLTGGKFIGLSLATGELIWDIDEVKFNLTNQKIDFGFSEPNNPFLDERTGHIFMLQGEVLIDFDLSKLEATYKYSVKDDLKSEIYPFIEQSRIHNEKIYFTARSSISGNTNMVGIFDLEENRISHQHIFEFDKGTFIPNSQDNIQVNNQNLFVLDNNKTLHIIELP